MTEATNTAAPGTPVVQADSFLTLHYRLSGPQGDVIDTFLEQPATLSLGNGELSPAIEVALARFAEFKDLQKQVADLELALETRKLVDRAKGILMDKQGLTEAEAFRKVQKMSMDNRKPMKDVAEAIILAHQVGQG